MWRGVCSGPCSGGGGWHMVGDVGGWMSEFWFWKNTLQLLSSG